MPHILFYVPLKPGKLMLVETEDGFIRLLRDDAPADGRQWATKDLDQAIVAFQLLKRELLQGYVKT